MSECCENCRRAGPLLAEAEVVKLEVSAVLRQVDAEDPDEALVARADELTQRLSGLLAQAQEWVGA